MIVNCPDCGRNYDDLNRWTICPHRYLGQSPKEEERKTTMVDQTTSPDTACAPGEPVNNAPETDPTKINPAAMLAQDDEPRRETVEVTEEQARADAARNAALAPGEPSGDGGPVKMAPPLNVGASEQGMASGGRSYTGGSDHGQGESKPGETLVAKPEPEAGETALERTDAPAHEGDSRPGETLLKAPPNEPTLEPSTMLPTVGRVVYAFGKEWDGPRRADIVGVNDDGTVNLAVSTDPARDTWFSRNSGTHLAQLHQFFLDRVTIYEPLTREERVGVIRPVYRAEWMAYQVKKAAQDAQTAS